MSVDRGPVDPRVVEVVREYRRQASEHSRQALINSKSHRPLMAQRHAHVARTLRRAAFAEELDPTPSFLLP